MPLSWFALVAALVAAACVAIPSPGVFFAMALGTIAFAAGVIAFRRHKIPGPARLRGAGAVAIALVALVLGVAKYLLTLAALERMSQI